MSLENPKMTIQGILAMDENALSDFCFDFLDSNLLQEELLLYTYERPLLAITTPSYFKLRCRHFCATHYSMYKEYVNTLALKYNVLENYDRTEEHTYTEKGTNEGHADNTGGGTTTEKVSAYDANTFTDSSQNEETNTSHNDSNGKHDLSTKTTSHIHGNIGVTTATQMQKEYIQMLLDNNVYKKIVETFVIESNLWYYFFS